MNFIIWLVIGGVIGWLASMVMKTNAQQGIILNIVVGIVGALLGGWLLAPLFGTGTINQNDFSIGSVWGCRCWRDHPARDRQPGTSRQPALNAPGGTAAPAAAPAADGFGVTMSPRSLPAPREDAMPKILVLERAEPEFARYARAGGLRRRDARRCRDGVPRGRPAPRRRASTSVKATTKAS